MTAEQRLIHGVLAVGGSLSVHALVYAVFVTGNGVSGHRSTDGLSAIAISGILGTVALAIGRSALRRGAVDVVLFTRLMPAQLGLFAGQELLEGLGAGASLGSLVAAPTFITGLALQPLVAGLLVALARGARRVGAQLEAQLPTPAPAGAAMPWQPIPVLAVAAAHRHDQVRTRAPPG